MRLLILGGSVFLGRALTDAALDKGHAVTHFRRGRSAGPDPRVETILGDRTGDLAALDALLETCRQAAASGARFEWMDAAFLAGHGARPWTKMPLQMPEDDPLTKGSASVSVARALAAGLRFRSQAQTVADTLAWSRTRPADHEWKAGLSPGEESALLAAWDLLKKP